MFCSPVMAKRQPRRRQEVSASTQATLTRFPVLALGLLVIGAATGPSQTTPAGASDSQGIIQFLNQTLNWHRELALERQIATEPSDVLVVNDNRQVADQVVRFAFDFARAEAQWMAKQAGSSEIRNQSAGPSQYQSLLQLSGKLDDQVRELDGELQSLRQKLETATGRKRRDLQSNIAEVQSEADLTNARRDAIHSMVEFVSGTSTSGLGATGLLAQIEALARSVPADLTQPLTTGQNNSSGSQQSNSAFTSGSSKPEPSGIWGLAADLFSLSSKIHTLEGIIKRTDALAESSKQLRAPLVNKLTQLSQQGDVLANQADTANPSTLAQEKKDLDALTAQFKQISAAVLPLSKQGILLGLYKTSLTNWQTAIKSRYRTELKSLALRLVFLGVVLAIVIGLAELWRRAIFRYVHEPRRRYQFLLLRKIVFWFVIAIVVAFAFATQLGSVATFAGLITAGVAVALQNVILSIAGYFFLIGRFGIRVGDRVQIAGVTGEVVDIGLVRLHLLELGNGAVEAPTGRVVAFSNSIVFQPTAGLFKQIPGTSFVWHEITLTLSPDSEYHVVEERLLGVVEAVFEDYREEMERQRRYMESTLSSMPVNELRPRSRLRLTQSGLEAVIRFPVDLQNATEIDDRVTRELLKAIDREPKLKLVGSGTPSIRLGTDLSSSTATSREQKA
jgi:small-conductance mechanosensitive channel